MKKQKNKSSSSSPDSAAVRPHWSTLDPDAGLGGGHERPIPSRTLILRTLAQHAGPLTFEQLIEQLGMTPDEPISAVEKRLQAMERDGQIVQNRNGAYGPVSRMNLIAGVVQAHRDGFGFVIPDAGGTDIFLGPRQMRSLMNGDRVLVRIVGKDHRGRPEGTLAEVLERASRDVVGRLHIEQGVSYVIPENPRVQQDVLIPPEKRMGARQGQMVVAELTSLPGARTLPVGRVKEILGDHLAPGMEIVTAIRAHNLPHDWPQAVEREAEAIADTVQPEQLKGREDIRHLPLVTIDGADARDFDDAVYCQPLKSGMMRKGGWTLWVAIADVAAYVKPGAPLDVEGQKRGNSVYFPRQVIPMLPEKLSNGLCSLNPNVDRLCMVCEMHVLPDGEINKARFFEGVMLSKARLIYEDVAAILENPQGAEAQKHPALVPHLQALNDVFEALFKAREKRGAIDFETTETKIVFSGERKIDKIVPVQRNRAHRLIEECMVAANVQAAKFVEKNKVPNLYRVHDDPDPLKVTALREFLAGRGVTLGGGDKPQAMDYAKALAKAKGRPDAALIQTVMLRSMMQAQYSPANSGHYGLALTHYAHFTSPIRRYPDLLLHRAIKHILHKRKPADFGYTAEQMTALGTHCSMTERRADEATREVTNWLKCEFMSHRVGEEYEGAVSGVTSFGLFVMLDELFVDGLIHISSLKNDYYEFDARRHRLTGTRTRMVYALGDRVRVKVTRVSLDERKIDLELLTRTGGAGHSSAVQPSPRKSTPPSFRKRKSK